MSNQLDVAIRHARTAVGNDPLSLVFPSLVGHLSYCLRRYDEAIAQFEQVLEREPRFFHALLHLGDVYFTLGEYANVQEAWDRAQAVVGEDSSYLLARQVALSAALGRIGEAQSRLDALEERARRRHTPAAFMAVAYLGVGDHARVFEWLARAVDEGTALPCIWATFPWADPVRSDARFEALLQRMNLPAQA